MTASTRELLNGRVTLEMQPDEHLVVIEPSAMTRVACEEAAAEMFLALDVFSCSDFFEKVAKQAVVVIVVEQELGLNRRDLTDIAVSVGAQLVEVTPKDLGPVLAQRIKLAISASRSLRRPVAPSARL